MFQKTKDKSQLIDLLFEIILLPTGIKYKPRSIQRFQSSFKCCNTFISFRCKIIVNYFIFKLDTWFYYFYLFILHKLVAFFFHFWSVIRFFLPLFTTFYNHDQMHIFSSLEIGRRLQRCIPRGRQFVSFVVYVGCMYMRLSSVSLMPVA